MKLWSVRILKKKFEKNLVEKIFFRARQSWWTFDFGWFGGNSSYKLSLLRAALITSGPDHLRRLVCLFGNFVILPKGKWALHRGFSRMVLWPEKRPHYFSGPKSCCQLRTFSTGIGPKRDPKTGHLFRLFWTFFASESHFFERRTSSHVGWVVIIRWRLRAPCLQVLSSYMDPKFTFWIFECFPLPVRVNKYWYFDNL